MGLNILTAAGSVQHGSDASLDAISIGTECHLFIPSSFSNGQRLSFKSAGAGTIHSAFLVDGVGNLNWNIQASVTVMAKETSGEPVVLNRPNFGAITFSFGVSGSWYHATDTKPLTIATLASDSNGVGTPGDDSAGTQWVGSNGGATQPSLSNQLFWGKWRRLLTVYEIETVRQWAMWLTGVVPTPPLNDNIPWRDCVAWVPYGQTDIMQVDYSPARNNGIAGGSRPTPPTPITDPYPWQPPLPTQLFPSL